MTMLIAGLILFTGTHLFLVTGAAHGVKETLGENGRKGLVALGSGAGLALIVMGWRSAEIQWIYAPPPGLRHAGALLTAIAIYLFVVSNRPSVIKRHLRHPQLTGVLLWGVAHLLMNGESRSLILFGGFALWSVLEIILINRRDRNWEKPAAPGLGTDLVTAVVAVVVIAGLIWGHPWLAGVPVIPGG